MNNTEYSDFYNLSSTDNIIDIILNNENKFIDEETTFRTSELQTVPGEYDNYILENEPEKYPEMNFRELVEESSKEIPNTTYASHGISSHPATFIPHIPGYIINHINNDNNNLKILDPFNGQGTTAIESLLNGCDYTGIEINPISMLMSEVATTVIPPDNLDRLINLSKENISELSLTGSEKNVQFPGRTNKEHWFEKNAIKDLMIIRKLINDINVNSILTNDINNYITIEDIEKILTLAFVNTVFEVSNADPGISKAYKSKKMRNRIKEGEHPPDGKETFIIELNKICKSLKSLWNKLIDKYNSKELLYNRLPNIEIKLSDSREFLYDKKEIKSNLVITSPPYINAINYYRGSKLRLFWSMDILESFYDFDVTNLKKEFIGSNSVRMKNVDKSNLPLTIESVWDSNNDDFYNTRLPNLDKNIEDIYNLDQKTAEKKSYVTWKFFAEDMALTLEKIYRNISKGGYVFFVVGENTIGSQLIPTHKYIEDISTHLGKFSTTELDDTESFNLIGTAFDGITNRGLFKTRNHDGGVIECEWIIILQK